MITGPLEITWREPRDPTVPDLWWSNGEVSISGVIDGPQTVQLEHGLAFLDAQEITYSIQIPSGPQIVRWLRSSSIFAPNRRLDRFATYPISAAYLAWRPFYPDTTYAVTLPPADDADHDGQTNLMEFAYRTDPFNPNRPQLPVLAQEGDHFTICVPVPRPVSDGIVVTIQTSADMVTWTDAAATPVASAPVGQEKYRLDGIPGTIRRLFARTRVKLIAP